MALVASVSFVRAHAQQFPVLAREQILVTSVQLLASPDHQVVPRNIATTVTTQLIAPAVPASGTNGFTSADLLQVIPPDALVLAELRGPAFGTPVALVARPNEPFKIQPLAVTGLYVLDNIRLVSGGTTILEGTPSSATIEVIDKVLVSQVSSRALSAQEIQKKGIFVDQDNFEVVNFTAAFGIVGNQKTIDFPVVLPKRSGGSVPATPPPPTLPPLQPAAAVPPFQQLPQLQEAFQTTNVSISGLLLKIEDEDIARQFTIPPIPGVIIIPGNIAYLHQFFSVLLMVSNVAPGNSNLVVRDITATIVLPTGADTVADTGDDPLKMARVGTPPVEQSKTQPVKQLGPDGRLGTEDDIPSLAPGQSGDGEYLVEGRKEGTHTVQMQITGTLDGLPVGPVKISGFATGVVEVRNPTFALTLSHPATVTAGEEYDLLVTVTNTSETIANLVSVSLLPNSISGAILKSDQSVQVDTIAARDSATVSFHLLSQQTGNVSATSFVSDDVPGKFELRTAVGALGIPLSPNTLVLPPAAKSLPADLRNAGIGLLGQAFALATSPVVPQGLLPITQQIVYERATNLAQAGQRLGMEDSLPRVAADLALDFTGNGFTRIAERLGADQASLVPQAQQDYRGFDELLRRSARGTAFLQLMAGIFAGEVRASGALEFQSAWAGADASRPPYISAITGLGGGAAPVVLSLTGPDGKRLGMTAADSAITRDLPYANFFSLIDEHPHFSQLGLVSVPTAGTYSVALAGTGTGTFDLGLVVPEGSQLRQVTYQGVAITPGTCTMSTAPPANHGLSNISRNLFLATNAPTPVGNPNIL